MDLVRSTNLMIGLGLWFGGGYATMTGCECDVGQAEIFFHGFESGCEQTLCGWNLEAGQAERISTFHAGEHGLKLSNEASVTIEPQNLNLLTGTDPTAFYLGVRCDPGASLRLNIEVSQEDQIESLSSEVSLGFGSDSPVISLLLAALPAPSFQCDLSCASCQPCWITRIHINQFGQGSCTIDDIRILSGDYRHCYG